MKEGRSKTIVTIAAGVVLGLVALGVGTCGACAGCLALGSQYKKAAEEPTAEDRAKNFFSIFGVAILKGERSRDTAERLCGDFRKTPLDDKCLTAMEVKELRSFARNREGVIAELQRITPFQPPELSALFTPDGPDPSIEGCEAMSEIITACWAHSMWRDWVAWSEGKPSRLHELTKKIRRESGLAP